MFLLGRNNLESFCPHCSQPLNKLIGTVGDLHIPIVGGASAGKTSFLMANMYDLYRRKDIRLEFPEPKDEALFDRCSRDFARGMVVGKTAALSPDAFQVNVSDPFGKRRLLSVYDPAGELYREEDTLRRHEYYGHTDGILFLLDPFSLPEAKINLERELSASAKEVKPSDEEPQEVYDRMIATFRQHPQMKNSFGKAPFAVVVTKADAFGLEREIRRTRVPEPVMPTSQLGKMRKAVSRKTENPESDQVRQWLIKHGADNLVSGVEQDFQNVRYFYCSALGRSPDTNSAPFNPEKALDPLAWLLDHYDLQLDKASHGNTKVATASVKTSAWYKIGYKLPSAQKPYNQVIVLSLWAISLLGLLVWAALSFFNPLT